MNSTEILLSKLYSELPPLFTRQEIARNLGGVLTAKTLKNIDSKGRGPEVGQRLGKKFVYEKDSFIRWFKNYILTYRSSVY
jgi:hypothetical protein